MNFKDYCENVLNEGNWKMPDFIKRSGPDELAYHIKNFKKHQGIEKSEKIREYFRNKYPEDYKRWSQKEKSNNKLEKKDNVKSLKPIEKSENKEQWGVLAIRSGGRLGSASAWLKNSKGEILKFNSREEASKEAEKNNNQTTSSYIHYSPMKYDNY